MTQQELDHLFSEARTTPTQTSVEEVTAWIGAAAVTASGVLGLAAKLKLFIAKKTIIMIGSLIGAAGITTVGIALLSPAAPQGSENTNTALLAPQEPKTEQRIEDVNPNPEPEDSIMLDLGEMNFMESLQAFTKIEPVIQLSMNELQNFEFDFAPLRICLAPLTMENWASVDCASGKDDDKRKTVKGSGNVISEVREVKPFTKLEVSGFFDVYLTQGDKESVRVEADDNLIQYIMTENQGSTLSLFNDCSVNVKNSARMSVYVTVKDLEAIDNQGIGNLRSSTVLGGQNLAIENSAVGNMSLELNYSKLSLTYSAVGDVSLTGKVDKAVIESSGVGNIRAFELQTREMEVSQSGVGDVDVFANESIDIEFTGVGNVRYKGNPGSKNIEKNGVGSVKAQ